MVKPGLKPERGVALLITLLTMALMTLLIVDFTTTVALGYRAAANQADEMRAYYLARSGVQVGIAILGQSALAQIGQQNAYDGLDQAWAQPIPPIPVEGGRVSLSIVDEARKVDINELYDPQKNIVDPNFEPVVARLLSNIGVSTDLIPIMVDWLDPDSLESPGGAKEDYYLRLTPPYAPRNGPMPTIGDLRMLKGVDDPTFMILSRFLTTMPGPTIGANTPPPEAPINPNTPPPAVIAPINVNTAPPEVLAALRPELENNPDLVKEIIAARTEQPFDQTRLAQIQYLPGIDQFWAHLTPLLTTRSSYFTITGEGDFAGARKRIYATVRRDLNGTAMLINWHED